LLVAQGPGSARWQLASVVQLSPQEPPVPLVELVLTEVVPPWLLELAVAPPLPPVPSPNSNSPRMLVHAPEPARPTIRTSDVRSFIVP